MPSALSLCLFAVLLGLCTLSPPCRAGAANTTRPSALVQDASWGKYMDPFVNVTRANVHSHVQSIASGTTGGDASHFYSIKSLASPHDPILYETEDSASPPSLIIMPGLTGNPGHRGYLIKSLQDDSFLRWADLGIASFMYSLVSLIDTMLANILSSGVAVPIIFLLIMSFKHRGSWKGEKLKHQKEQSTRARGAIVEHNQRCLDGLKALVPRTDLIDDSDTSKSNAAINFNDIQGLLFMRLEDDAEDAHVIAKSEFVESLSTSPTKIAKRFFLGSVVVPLLGLLVSHLLIQLTILSEQKSDAPEQELDLYQYFYGLTFPLDAMMCIVLSNMVGNTIELLTPVDRFSSAFLWVLIYYTIRRAIRAIRYYKIHALAFLLSYLGITFIYYTQESWMVRLKPLHTPQRLRTVVSKRIMVATASLLALAGLLVYNLNTRPCAWLRSFIFTNVWMFFIEDFHIILGFLYSDWSSLVFKSYSEGFSIPSIFMTLADCTFLLAIYISEYIQNFSKLVASGNYAVCDADMDIDLHCVSFEFLSFTSEPQPDISRTFVSDALGIDPSEVSFARHFDPWFANHLMRVIFSTPWLHSLFKTRLILPLVFIATACLKFYLNWTKKVASLGKIEFQYNELIKDAYLLCPKDSHAKGDEKMTSSGIEGSLEVGSRKGCLSCKSTTERQADRERQYLQRLRNFVGTPMDVAKIETVKEMEDESSALRKVMGELGLLFLIVIAYYIFEHILYQASLFYIYDCSPSQAVEKSFGWIFTWNGLWTYCFGFVFANALEVWRPYKVHGRNYTKLHFFGSLIWCLFYYLLRRTFRNAWRWFSFPYSIFVTSLLAALLCVGGSLGGQRAVTLRALQYINANWRDGSRDLTFDDVLKSDILTIYLPYTCFIILLAFTFWNCTTVHSPILIPVVALWNYLRWDFMFTCTFSLAAWISIFAYLRSVFPSFSIDSASELLFFIVIIVGKYASQYELN